VSQIISLKSRSQANKKKLEQLNFTNPTKSIQMAFSFHVQQCVFLKGGFQAFDAVVVFGLKFLTFL